MNPVTTEHHVSSSDDHQGLGPEYEKYDREKGDDGHAVVIAAPDDVEGIIAAEHQFTDKEYKRLLRKIDMIIMPLLMISYGLQYVDKTSLSYGVVFGLKKDTNLVGQQYQLLSAWFYLAYACAQLPMGYLLQRFPLGRGLGVCLVLWGAMVMLLGACHNYAELSVVRVLLGWFESVITPCFAILTSSWYLRKEQTLRQNMYYAMNQCFSLIFGIAIYELALNAERHGGLAAWRVINLFLGGVTVGVGFIFLVFVGTPTEVWWLTKREKLMAHARIVSNSTGGGEQHPWRWDQVKDCLRDPQYWHAIAYNFLACIPNGAVTTFQTLIMASFGFNSLQTVLYQLPGNAVTLVILVATAVTVHYKPKTRFAFCLLYQFVCVFIFFFEGFAPTSMSKWAKWGVFLPIATFSITSFLLWPLMSVNIAGRTKKSFYGATTFFAYCAGNVVGSQIFLPKDAPRYIPGLVSCAAIMLLNCVNLVGWWHYYVRTNRKREAAFVVSGLTEEEREHANRVAGETDITDCQNPHFRYSC